MDLPGYSEDSGRQVACQEYLLMGSVAPVTLPSPRLSGEGRNLGKSRLSPG